MALLGFDFDAGRLDTTQHPFTGGVPEDVRMATRFDETNFLPALIGTIHETGHSRYQQNLPRAWLGQPLRCCSQILARPCAHWGLSFRQAM